MSDLFEVREKTEKGADWRGSINVSIDGETKELTVRQLRDPEFWEVMSLIDTEELETLQSDLPEDKMSEFRDLQNKDTLSDEEADRLEELQNEVEDEDINLFEILSFDTYQGIKTAAKYGVEPDEGDIQTALTNHAGEINEKYGGTSHDDAVEYVNDHIIDPMIEESTNFTSFAIGVKCLGQTLGDTGN